MMEMIGKLCATEALLGVVLIFGSMIVNWDEGPDHPAVKIGGMLFVTGFLGAVLVGIWG